MRRSNWTRAMVALSLAASFIATGCGDGAQTASPPPTLNLVGALEQAGEFNTLLAAVDAADLTDALSNDGPFTVFAPTDAAFELVDPEVLEFLLRPENQADLVFVLLYHALDGEFFENVLPEGSTIAETLNGESIDITKTGDEVRINDEATVIQTDIRATNGVIHAINRVLIPPAGSN